MPDALLILSRGRTVADVEALATVRQRYGDRVLVVSSDAPGALAGLGTLLPAGQTGAVADDGFTTTETMGIDAWNLRQGFEGKQRPGDGLPWDAVGKAPP